jgi:hypothetical protein
MKHGEQTRDPIMKKSVSRISKHRKLVLHREAIVSLMPLQLSNAMGGDGAVSTTNCITNTVAPDCTGQ